jgi:hypothetical protein
MSAVKAGSGTLLSVQVTQPRGAVLSQLPLAEAIRVVDIGNTLHSATRVEREGFAGELGAESIFGEVLFSSVEMSNIGEVQLVVPIGVHVFDIPVEFANIRIGKH